MIKHGMSNTRLYRIWSSMIRRCNNPNVNNYSHYGERGINVCDEWRDNFMDFYKWAMENGYKENLTIDRFPNKNGDYNPLNCRWANMTEQNRNRRTSHFNISGMNGVSFHKQSHTWWAHITVNYKTINLGYHKTKEAAAEARAAGEQKYWAVNI